MVCPSSSDEMVAMPRNHLLALLILSGPLLLAGCDKATLQKSENPLSPTIAGPLSGVTFSGVVVVAETATIKRTNKSIVFQ